MAGIMLISGVFERWRRVVERGHWIVDWIEADG